MTVLTSSQPKNFSRLAEDLCSSHRSRFCCARFELFLIPIFSGGDPSPYTTNPVISFETSKHYYQRS